MYEDDSVVDFITDRWTGNVDKDHNQNYVYIGNVWNKDECIYNIGTLWYSS